MHREYLGTTLNKVQNLTWELWGRAWDGAFLTGAQVPLRLWPRTPRSLETPSELTGPLPRTAPPHGPSCSSNGPSPQICSFTPHSIQFPAPAPPWRGLPWPPYINSCPTHPHSVPHPCPPGPTLPISSLHSSPPGSIVKPAPQPHFAVLTALSPQQLEQGLSHSNCSGNVNM